MSVAEPTAQERTASLERLNFVPFDLIDDQENNPNEMSDAEFNLLYDNMAKIGFVDPMLLRRKPNGRYSLIGGHHRKEVAKLHDMLGGPATVITDPEFDSDQEKFQVVRMNMIRGKLSPDKFLKMYQSLQGKYDQEIMAQAFGFADEEQFNKIVGQMASALPKDMQAAFKKAAKEIKTIDGLAKLLNSMFTKYGDTLPYGFMVVDFGGQDSLWLRMSNDTRKAMNVLGKRLIEEQRTMDDILGGLVQLIAQGKLDPTLKTLVDSSPQVVLANGQIPTYEQG